MACNSLAMLSLGRGDPARCRDLLARALDLASDANITAGEDRRGGGALGRDPADVDPALQVLTLNNTACLHRRYGNRPLRMLYFRFWPPRYRRADVKIDERKKTEKWEC